MILKEVVFINSVYIKDFQNLGPKRVMPMEKGIGRINEYRIILIF